MIDFKVGDEVEFIDEYGEVLTRIPHIFKADGYSNIMHGGVRVKFPYTTLPRIVAKSKDRFIVNTFTKL